jgi:hypothetical protein
MTVGKVLLKVEATVSIAGIIITVGMIVTLIIVVF